MLAACKCQRRCVVWRKEDGLVIVGMQGLIFCFVGDSVCRWRCWAPYLPMCASLQTWSPRRSQTCTGGIAGSGTVLSSPQSPGYHQQNPSNLFWQCLNSRIGIKACCYIEQPGPTFLSLECSAFYEYSNVSPFATRSNSDAPPPHPRNFCMKWGMVINLAHLSYLNSIRNARWSMHSGDRP